MFNRITAVIMLFTFFMTFLPAPSAFALRQETADGSAIGGVERELAAAKGVGEAAIKTVAVITDDTMAGNDLAEILLEFDEYNYDTAVKTISGDISDEELQALIDKYKGQDCFVVVKINNEELLEKFNGYAKGIPAKLLILEGEDRDIWEQQILESDV